MRAGSVSGRGTYAGERSSSLYNDGEGGDNAQGEREPFPNRNGRKKNTDYTPDSMALNKNIDRHGDQLVYVEETLVAQIPEEDPDEETTVTQMIAYGADENFYHLYSLCGYSDIYENDVISFYGLPPAISSFENQAGGTPSVIMIAASHAKKGLLTHCF